MKVLRTVLAAAAVAAGVAACTGRDSPAATLVLAECRLPRLASFARCGEIEVPERRIAAGATVTAGAGGDDVQSPASGDTKPRRTLRIHVAVLPANTLSPAPDPLFLLAGGPGQAASALAPLAAMLERVRRERDIVLVDQRGTGRSSPLACAALRPTNPLQAIGEGEAQLRRVAECRSELEGRGVDLRQYTTPAYIADLEDVRRALGYERVNLWGGSYGTRVAQEYLRRHPERVRSVVLDGVAPPSLRIPLDIWPARDARLADVLASCAAQPACAAALPGLDGELARAGARLAEPATVVVADPWSGAPTEIRVTREMLLGALHALTYAPESASLIPVLVARAAKGDYAPLAAAAEWVAGRLAEDTIPALHYAVVCSEDLPRIGAGEVERVLGRTLSGELSRLSLRACAGWPRGEADPALAQPVASDTPALLLSGGLDPVTPPANAERVARSLPRSRHVVAAGFGHIVSTSACVPDLIGAFVERADVDRLPQACIEFLREARGPLPFVSPLGPDARP